MTSGRVEHLRTTLVQGAALALDARDDVAVEEPLEIRICARSGGEPVSKTVAITLRTPGDDLELAVGYLHNEGVLCGAGDIASARVFNTRQGECVARIELRPGLSVQWKRLERAGAVTSSCGACGKTSSEAMGVLENARCVAGNPLVTSATLHALPVALRGRQAVFARTGGLHAAALFDTAGELLLLREDVGRHNALDKLIGAAVLAGALPWRDRVLFLSGRVGFELVQKAVMAGVGLMAAVGAPSSMAVDAAQRCGMTLAGFVRDGRFNIYSHPERVLAGLQA